MPTQYQICMDMVETNHYNLEQILTYGKYACCQLLCFLILTIFKYLKRPTSIISITDYGVYAGACVRYRLNGFTIDDIA